MEIFEMEKEFDALMKRGQELIEKLKKEKVADDSKKVKRWKPKDGGSYWYIYGDGTIDFHFGLSTDNALLGRYKLGNCFKTKEEAQKEVERRVVEQELLDMCDWDETSELWSCIYYDTHECEFRITNFTGLVLNPYRFANEKSARKAIEQLGTERLKLIFRID